MSLRVRDRTRSERAGNESEKENESQRENEREGGVTGRASDNQ